MLSQLDLTIATPLYPIIYTIYNLSASYLSNFVEVVNQQPKLEIAANNILGTYTFNVEGKMENKKCFDNFITLKGFPKDGDDGLPKFLGGLQDQSVKVGAQQVYQLPSVQYPAECGKFKILIDPPNVNLFTEYIEISNQLVFRPSSPFNIGSQMVNLLLDNNMGVYTQYNFTLQIYDAPRFSSQLHLIYEVAIGS